MRRSEIRRDDLSDAWIEEHAEPSDLADWRYMRERHPGHVKILNAKIDRMLEDGLVRNESLWDHIQRTVAAETDRRIMRGILVEANAYWIQTKEARLERIRQQLRDAKQAHKSDESKSRSDGSDDNP